ncbi:Cof-type HAD-IIB family hydrolase [Bacillus massilinigeriensis]|uniref:Cof-type HAD-IIB family hydrolase n=1 Tax=Bacillus massilionigeriensis TaxID=1805475 RepID=UPI00096AFA6C|nr:Cof-type HAD-IIB family hydrolase [Bacillus massilionigeriensis]
MIKCIATDMDGTLLTPDQRVTEENIQAIKQAQSLGIEVVIATGRSYQEATFVLEDTGLIVPFICVNGAEVRSSQGEVITSNPLDKELAKAANHILDEHEIYYEVYTNNGSYTSDLEKSITTLANIITSANPDINIEYVRKRAEERLLKGLVHEIENYDLLIESNDHEIYKMLAFANRKSQLTSSATNLDKIQGLSVSSSGYNNIELTSVHAQKGLALEAFVNKRGISLEDTMAIGDNFNDLSMLKKVGRAVAMGNAEEKIKAECHYVTATNMESGVGKAILEAIRRN